MIYKIAYYQILFFPVIAWLGVISLSLLLMTAVFPWLKTKGYIKWSFVWHVRLAKITVVIAIIHAIIALGVTL